MNRGDRVEVIDVPGTNIALDYAALPAGARGTVVNPPSTTVMPTAEVLFDRRVRPLPINVGYLRVLTLIERMAEVADD